MVFTKRDHYWKNLRLQGFFVNLSYNIYTGLIHLAIPFFLMSLWWKGRYFPAYRKNILERFCLDNVKPTQCDVWINVVSLGEVIAIFPLIDSLLRNKRRILITTMTPTGAEQIKMRFGSQVTHRYTPYDLPVIVRRFFKIYQPHVAVFSETEIWPNLIKKATKVGIPLFLINARISELAYKIYKKLPMKLTLDKCLGILVQTQDDAQRFIEIGANAKSVSVFGNMKFDLQTERINKEIFETLKKHWGEHRVVMIAASTHEGEEQLILSRLRKLQAGLPSILLLLAPRHPQRFQKIFKLSVKIGFNTGLRSQVNSISAKNEVIIIDSIGELLGFYQVSNYAFVGGSLVPIGGHNVIEPIAMGVPVLCGHYLNNFKGICHDLLTANGIIIINHVDSLIEEVVTLHQNPNKKINLINAASRVIEANKGAVSRYIQKIEQTLQHRMNANNETEMLSEK
jgi:3-deoxy-D-manno-octulosonic-acid transferase